MTRRHGLRLTHDGSRGAVFAEARQIHLFHCISIYLYTRGDKAMFESMDLSSLLPSRRSDGEYTELASGGEQQQEQPEEGWWPSLTWKERLLGCATCMIGGYILSFGSLFRLKNLILGNPSEYVARATS